MRKLFREKKKDSVAVETVSSVRSKTFRQSGEMCLPLSKKNLYDEMRLNVPAIDGSIDLCVRLCGGFDVKCENKQDEKMVSDFLKRVNVNGISTGIDAFVTSLLSSLLTYGTAIGEIVYDKSLSSFSLFNSDLTGLTLKRGADEKTVDVCRIENGEERKIRDRENLLVCVLDPKADSISGRSVLEGLPFVSSILMQIFDSIGTNWKRFGDIRYAVSCKGSSDGFASERAKQIAEKWHEAMNSDEVKDFVAVGDVDVKVIGADGQILDSQVPVKQLMEQIIAKLGIPPFLLGMSNSTTETMAKQQIEIFKTELEHFRRIITPVLEKICDKYLRLIGSDSKAEIVFREICPEV